MSKRNKRDYTLPVAAVGIAAVFLVVFVYGYPRLFPLIDASYPEHFEKNVADATSRGDVRGALKIARHATEVRPFDPMAYTVLGRVLLANGEADPALEQLANAVGLRKKPRPSRRDTQEPYYFAPARLTLGKYYLEQGRVADATVDFELARAYAEPSAPEYRDFQAALYRTYARQGFWARALEFGTPSDQELDELGLEEILGLARVWEGGRNWDLAGGLAERLSMQETFSAEAHYFLGRAEFGRADYRASVVHLEQAALNGVPHAAFFLGMAFKRRGQTPQAIEAFLRTPAGDVYRAFALAKAAALLPDLPEEEQSLTATRQELLGQIDLEIAAISRFDRAVPHDKYRRFTPLAAVPSEAYAASGGRFPILILWEDGQAPAADPTRLAFSHSDEDGSLLLLRGTGTILQLQWVENLVNWASIERLEPGAGAVPGWIDTARDWFELRSDGAAQIHADNDGNAFLGISKPTWLYSVPISARDGIGYLLAGRLRAPRGEARFGWQFLNDEERVLLETAVLDQEECDAWTWHADYMPSQLHWDALRVKLEVLRHPGTLAVDDVMLVGLTEPDPTALN